MEQWEKEFRMHFGVENKEIEELEEVIGYISKTRQEAKIELAEKINIDKFLNEIHGGGNGRRLLLQIKDLINKELN